MFPQALCASIPCGAVAALLKFCMEMQWVDFDGTNAPIRDVSAWSAFSFFVGFLIVFRTSQAYTRFWEGCTASHAMRAEWWDACAAIIAFSKYSNADIFSVRAFQHMIVRLFSLLHAVALAEMEDRGTDSTIEDIEAFSFEAIDVQGLDKESLAALMRCECKIEMIYSWIQCLLVEHLDSVLVIPTPLLTRVFQELSNGMVHFHGATKLSCIPFPYPYIQACEWLLIIHWVFCPIVMSQWVYHWPWAFAFTFIQVFILWALAYIAKQIENPFGHDSTDLDRRQMQVDMNSSLLTLISDAAKRAPTESSDAELTSSMPASKLRQVEACGMKPGRMSLANTWGRLSQPPRPSQGQAPCREDVLAPMVPAHLRLQETEGLFAIPDSEVEPLRVEQCHDEGVPANTHSVGTSDAAIGRGLSLIERVISPSSSFLNSVMPGVSRGTASKVVPDAQVHLA